MSASLAALAIRRQELVERSALCRIRLHDDACAVRAAVSWKQVPVALAAAPAMRTMAWSLALSLLGTGRAGRILLYASRALLVVKVARAAIGYARGRSTAV
jgi:hypothetical protein